jgi:hypothetical protein
MTCKARDFTYTNQLLPETWFLCPVTEYLWRLPCFSSTRCPILCYYLPEAQSSCQFNGCCYLCLFLVQTQCSMTCLLAIGSVTEYLCRLPCFSSMKCPILCFYLSRAQSSCQFNRCCSLCLFPTDLLFHDIPIPPPTPLYSLHPD